MDPEAFLDVANQVTKLKMYPYFDLAHSAVCLLAIREDLGAGEEKDTGYVMGSKLRHLHLLRGHFIALSQ